MMSASSSADHLLCFLAGDSEGWAGILRFRLTPVLVVAYEGGSDSELVGTEADLVWWGFDGDDGEDSFESGPLRRREISTLTV
jgi:hypothetical protein